MRVDHGGAHIFVTQEFLHCSDIVARFQQIGREQMREGMAGTALDQVGARSALYPDRS